VDIGLGGMGGRENKPEPMESGSSLTEDALDRCAGGEDGGVVPRAGGAAALVGAPGKMTESSGGSRMGRRLATGECVDG
jgi:hypothetical protein